MEFSEVKKKFPKKRPKLSKQYLDVYERHYKDNREGKGFFNFLSSYMESWAHKIIAKKKFDKETILELGAGTLNHLKYEKNYLVYDIVEPFKNLYKNSVEINNIDNFYESIFEIKNKKYDRIISIMTFEHLEDLPGITEKCKDLLKKKGTLQIAIPCEGEYAFKLGWKLTTALGFRMKYGLDYSKIMEHEHLNSLNEILIVLNHYFKIKKFLRSPFILPFKNCSFYCVIECSNN